MSDYTEKVSILAHELWELAGRPDGRSDEFWFAAEAKLAETKLLESDTKTEAAIADFTSSESEAGQAPDSAGPFENAA